MLRRLFLAIVALCLLMCVPALGEEPKPEKHVCRDYEYVILEDGTAEITRYNGKEEKLILPAELDGIRVTSLKFLGMGCPVTNVEIPDSITSIESNPFTWCSNLSIVSVSPDHPTLAVIDGVLFSKPDKRLICYPCDKKGTEYVIPQGIQTIGEHAFLGSEELTHIVIPDSVTTIGGYAFYYCVKLTSITIPDNVTSIGVGAFSWSGLKDIAIPNSVIRLGEFPFSGCMDLQNIEISSGHPALEVIDGVLFSKQERRLICYPAGKKDGQYDIPEGTQIIGEYAFYNCVHLSSITIPDGVLSIEADAFDCCEALESILIPESVTSIGKRAFANCKSITTLTIPNEVMSIGEAAFLNCDNLAMTVTRGSYAAEYCKENQLNYTYTDSLDWLNN